MKRQLQQPDQRLIHGDASRRDKRLGFDDPRVLGRLSGIGLEHLTGVDALNVFREIRLPVSDTPIR